MIKGHVTPHNHYYAGEACFIMLLNKAKKFTAYTIVDKQDAFRVLSRRWHMSKKGYASSTLNGKAVKLHNFITGIKGLDHINRNKLDNRRCNLRAVTHSQNMHNTDLSSKNTSGTRGVCRNKNTGLWHAYIKIEGKTHQKVCRTKEQAIEERRLFEVIFASRIKLP